MPVTGQVRGACRAIPDHAVLTPRVTQMKGYLTVTLIRPEVRREERTLTTTSIVFDQTILHRHELLDLRGLVALRELPEERAVLIHTDQNTIGVAGDSEHPLLLGVQEDITRLEQAPEEHVNLLRARQSLLALTGTEYPIPPVGEDRAEVLHRSTNSGLLTLSKNLDVLDQVPEVKVHVNVGDVGENVHPVDQRTGQLRVPFRRSHAPVNREVQETLDRRGRENETLVLVSNENDVRQGLAALLKLLEVQDHLTQHAARSSPALEVQVILGFKQQSHALPLCVSVGAVGAGPRRPRKAADPAAVDALNVFLDHRFT